MFDNNTVNNSLNDTTGFPHLVLMPYWVKNQLDRNKLSLSTVLNLPELMKVCSLEDLTIMSLMNVKNDPVINSGLFNSLNSVIWDEKLNKETAHGVDKINVLKDLYKTNLDSRLLKNGNSNLLSSEYPIPFEIRLADGEINNTRVLIVVIYPGHFGTSATESKKKLIRECLKQSYAFVGYNVIAQNDCFLQYINSLQ